jgi:hypothetical protein
MYMCLYVYASVCLYVLQEATCTNKTLHVRSFCRRGPSTNSERVGSCRQLKHDSVHLAAAQPRGGWRRCQRHGQHPTSTAAPRITAAIARRLLLLRPDHAVAALHTNAVFLNVSSCLSRACLGIKILFCIKLVQKKAFVFRTASRISTPCSSADAAAVRPSRVLRGSGRCTRGGVGSCSGSVTFASNPSTCHGPATQPPATCRSLHAGTCRHENSTAPCGVARLSSAAPTVSVETNASCFERFPYVCPEPVSVK